MEGIMYYQRLEIGILTCDRYREGEWVLAVTAVFFCGYHERGENRCEVISSPFSSVEALFFPDEDDEDILDSLVSLVARREHECVVCHISTELDWRGARRLEADLVALVTPEWFEKEQAQRTTTRVR